MGHLDVSCVENHGISSVIFFFLVYELIFKNLYIDV